MVETALLTISFGFITFLGLAGLFEWRGRNRVPVVVYSSLGTAFLVQSVDGIVVDGTWGLITASFPEWVGQLISAIPVAFVIFSGYAVWRWAPDSTEELESDAERQLYRFRWLYVGLSVIIGSTMLLFFGLFAARSIGMN